MDLNLVIDRFKTDRDTLEINDIQYISSAVLLPLVIDSNQLCILLQIRSENQILYRRFTEKQKKKLV